MMYRDATDLLACLDVISTKTADYSGPAGTQLRREALLLNASVMAREYIMANRDIYMKIPERQSFEVIYSLRERLLKATDAHLDLVLARALTQIVMQFEKQRLQLDYVRKNFKRPEYASLEALLLKYRGMGQV